MNEAATKPKIVYIQALGIGESASLSLPGDRCASVTVPKPPILYCHPPYQDEQMDDEFIGGKA